MRIYGPYGDSHIQSIPTGAYVLKNPPRQNYRFVDDVGLQVFNSDTGLWMTLVAVGLPAQAVFSDLLPMITNDQNYRFRDGKGLQLFNPDTGLWHTLIAQGIPAQVRLDDGDV